MRHTLKVEKYVLFHRTQKAYVVCKKNTGTRLDGQDIWHTTDMDTATHFCTLDFAGVIQMELSDWKEYTPIRIVVSYTWGE